MTVDATRLEGLGNRLRDRRKQLERTLAQVASAAEISVSHLSAIEAGKTVPSLAVLAKVARSLEASIASLLAEAGPVPIARGELDPTEPGTQAIHHPDLRLKVISLVADVHDEGASPVGATATLLVHVRTGQLEVEIGGETHMLGSEDTLKASRVGVLRWKVLEGPSLSLWVAAPGSG